MKKRVKNEPEPWASLRRSLVRLIEAERRLRAASKEADAQLKESSEKTEKTESGMATDEGME